MGKKITMLLMFCLPALLSFSQTATPPSVGDGSSGNPYQIATLENLYWLSQNSGYWGSSYYYKQTADIDASSTSSWNSGTGWSPIGNSSTYFRGKYDGQGNAIDGLYISKSASSSNNFQGLFGYCYSATIQNLGLINVNIKAYDYCGGLIGRAINCTVKNCFTTGAIKDNDNSWYHGGLIGYVYSGNTLSNCYSSCTITGTSSNKYAGGLIGGIYNSNSITNCYATGNISGYMHIGGFLGINNYTGNVIKNCYSTGTVSKYTSSISNDYFGGFIGYYANSSITVTNCFWDTETSGWTTSRGGTGKTTAEMTTYATFYDAGWDFTGETNNGTNDIWAYSTDRNSSYPFLAWQGFTALEIGSISDLSLTSANCNFSITDGVSSISQYGICWNTTGNPTIADNYTNEGSTSSIGDYTSQLINLDTNKTYYVRAYAINSNDVSYSSCIGFESYRLPKVTTLAVSFITDSTATGNMSITDLGIPSLTAYGVCWNTTGEPTLSDSYVDKGSTSSTGTFSVPITGLTYNTTYYVRAFATNETGTVYGADTSFTALNADFSAPSVIHFDTIVGGTQSETFYVKNTGEGTLEITSASLPSSQYQLTPTTANIAAGDSLEFTLTFKPVSSASISGNLIFTSNAGSDTIKAVGVISYYASDDAGGAIDFDGSNDRIDCGSAINLANKSFSIDFWAQRGSIGTNDYIIGTGNSGTTDKELHIGFRADNTFTFAFYADDANTTEIYTDTEWHHWACVYDYDTKEQKIYRDGVLAGTHTSASTGFNASGTTFRIGCSAGISNFFDGLLDEVRVWNKALSQDEIRSQYMSLAGNEVDLIAYWRFDETTGTLAYDMTGNGNNGTLVNSPTRVNTSPVALGTPAVYSNLPSAVDFGNVSTSTPKINSYRVVNTGKGILNLDFSDYAEPFYVAPTAIGVLSGDTATVYVSMAPDTTGSYTDTITYSGNVNGGTIKLAGTAEIQMPENAGNGIYFNGTANRYIACGSDYDLAGKSFSVDFWAKRGAAESRNNFIIGWGVSGLNNLLHIGFRNSNVFTFDFGGNGLSTTQTYTDLNWHHWACTYDASTLMRKIYCDGVLVASGPASAQFQYTGTDQFKIGTYTLSDSYYFNGNLDEVRIWSKTLTQEEIRSQYGPLEGIEDSLLAYWRFDESDGAYVYDATGNGHLGTLENGASRLIPSTAPVADPVYSVMPDSALYGSIPLTESSNVSLSISNVGGGILHIENAFADSSYFSISPATSNIFSGDTAVFAAQYTPSLAGDQTGYYHFEHHLGHDSVYAAGYGVKASSISTVEVVDTFEISALVSVSIDSIGEPNTGYGLCWNTNGSPTVNDNLNDYGPAPKKGLDTLSMTGLEPATTYFVRSYILNNTYVAYGSEFEIKTYGPALLDAGVISNITDSLANCTFHITNTGNPALTSYGVCWATGSEPTIADNLNRINAAVDTGSYVLEMGDLIAGTTYDARAFAISSRDTLYSNTLSFLAANGELSLADTVEISVPIANTGETVFTFNNAGSVPVDITAITSDLDYFTATAVNSRIEAGESGEISLSYTAPCTEAVFGKLFITSNAGTDTIIVEGTAYQQAATDAGNGAEFDGTDDYIEFSKDISSLTDFSLEEWVYINATSQWERIFDFGNSKTYNVFLASSYNATNKPQFAIYINGTQKSIVSNTALTTKQWHHIAVTLEGSVATMYIDGVQVAQNTSFTFNPAGVGATTNNWIGKSQYSDPYFNGKIDEVRIWSKALTQDEIRSQYSSLVGNEDGLYAYWRFDEERTDSTFDATGNHNSGHFVNGVSRVMPSTAPVGQPELSFTQSSVDFGTTLVGNTTQNKTLEVSNIGGGILHINSITVGNTVFAVSPETANIMSQASASITASFDPESAGYYTDHFVFEHNAGKDSIAVEGYYVELSDILSIAMDETGGTSATVTVTIDPIGTPDPQQYGLCWNTTGFATLNDSFSNEGVLSAAGTYTLTASGLSPVTTYYIKLYVMNGSIVNYSEELTFTTAKRTPVITWTTPADIIYGTALSDEQLNAAADVEGTFVYSPVAGTVLQPGDNHQLNVAFTPADENTSYSAEYTVYINVIDKHTPVITWATPADITYGTALSDEQLNATADVEGTFVYSPAAGTVLQQGDNQQLSVVFTPAVENTAYSAEYSVYINVIEATAIMENNMEQKISLYPNPVIDVLYINSTNNSEIISYRLLSVTGELISAKILDGNTFTINMSQLNPGIYLLHLIQGDKEYSYKVTKK